jgi:anti-anti-sigma regulatory factor
MLHITRTDEEVRTTLRLAGRLTITEIPALDEACRACVAARRALVLNLAEVRYVDAAGAAVLHALRERSIEITGCSPFVRELLQEEVS